MSEKNSKLLALILKEENDPETDPKDAFYSVKFEDLINMAAELDGIESSSDFDERLLDILKSLLVYLLMKDGRQNREDIYSVVFGMGKNIIWN